MAYVKLTPEEKAANKVRRQAKRLALMARKRWYIQIGYKGDPGCRAGHRNYRRFAKNGDRSGWGAWPHGVWPKLFLSREAAADFAREVGVFRNVDPIPGRRKIKGYSIECVFLKAPEAA